MPTSEIQNLHYCFEVLRRRILEEDERLPYWEMNLRVTTYFLKRYDDEFDPDNWDYVKELSDSEESCVLHDNPLLQKPKAHGERSPGPSKEGEIELRERLEKYLQGRT